MGKWKEEHDRVPIAECVPRRLYNIKSRSLGPKAVYAGNGEFIGLRHEIVSTCIFTEYHWDQGAPYGTVFMVEDTGIDLPNGIELKEYVVNEEEKTFTTYKPLFDWLVEQGGRPS